MMLKGHNRTAASTYLRVQWQPCAVASFGQNARPNTPSICFGMQLGANSTGSTKSAERLFSDYRRSVH
jgi:hypothetical protein